jgi:hypothetical protein
MQIGVCTNLNERSVFWRSEGVRCSHIIRSQLLNGRECAGRRGSVFWLDRGGSVCIEGGDDFLGPGPKRFLGPVGKGTECNYFVPLTHTPQRAK